MEQCQIYGGAGGIRQGHLTPFGKFGAVDKQRNGLAWGNQPTFDYTPDHPEAKFGPSKKPFQKWLPGLEPGVKVKTVGGAGSRSARSKTNRRAALRDAMRTPAQRRRMRTLNV